MELRSHASGLLDAYVTPFATMAGDCCIGRLLGGVITGIIGSARLVWSHIAVLSLSVGNGAIARNGTRRVPRAGGGGARDDRPPGKQVR